MDSLIGELLHYANANDHEQVKLRVKQLPHVDAPIDPGYGWNALHMACACRDAATVTHILDCGADINAASREALHTPLHIACTMGSESTVRALLKYNPRLSAKDANGYIPLHYAVVEGYRAVVECLLEYTKSQGVFELLKETDNEGNTALALAQMSRNEKIAQILREFLLEHLPSSLVNQGEVSEMTKWLSETVGLPQYVPCFTTAGYTRLSFWAQQGITDAEYDKIGVSMVGHRRIIDKYLRDYQNAQGSESESGSGSESGSDEDSD